MRAITFLVQTLVLFELAIALDPLVNTKEGLIRGFVADDGDYSIFLGIPYAQVIDNPFGTAQPYPKFENTFEANDDSAVCPQYDNGIAFGTLDCLRLNIFVPTTASIRNQLPVMIWIHGGAFNTGYAQRYFHGPKNLVKNDVILVTMNYRLGPYGFMCLDIPAVPGNQGIKDQLMALRWVKENIASFGGDPDRITLMGVSAGSMSTELHLLSKQEKLFNRAILQSGTTIKPNGISVSDVTVPLKISEQLGLETENISEALSFLSKVDPILVVAAYTELSINLRPCVEKEFQHVESILTENPLNLDVPKVKDMPLLIGSTSREALMTDAIKPSGYFKQEDYILNTLEQMFVCDENFDEMEKLVRHFYFGDEELTDDLREIVIDFESDFHYYYGTHWIAEKLLRNGAQNIFQYMFSYDGGRNYIKNRFNITREGCAHGDELGYLFDMNDSKLVPAADDQLMIDRITKLWTNFAKHGNPTPEISELLPISWIPISEDTINYLNLDSELSLRKRPFSNRMSFWELFYKANEWRLKGYCNDYFY